MGKQMSTVQTVTFIRNSSMFSMKYMDTSLFVMKCACVPVFKSYRYILSFYSQTSHLQQGMYLNTVSLGTLTHQLTL